MKVQLNESLKHLDMKNQVYPTVGIDKFKSRIGDDSDFITLSFAVKSEEVGNDLSDWFERGYDYVIDCETSPGEVADRKFLVFVEMNRRTSSPKKILELISDLETLTGLSVEDWKVEIGDQVFPLDVEAISKNIKLSPHEYREEVEGQLNEFRQIAGIKTVNTHKQDQDILNIQRQAGII